MPNTTVSNERAEEESGYRVLREFLDAYLIKRNIPEALSAVGDDIRALLRGDWEPAVNREQLGERIAKELEEREEITYYKISSCSPKKIGPDFWEFFCTIECRGRMKAEGESFEILRFSAGMTYGSRIQITSLHVSERYRFLEKDYLTGVYNRERGEKLVRSGLERGEPYVFLMIDLDNFKRVNDIYGHGEGDHMLKYIAGRLKTVFRQTDVVLRLGGDEFAVFACPCGAPDVMESKIAQISGDYRREAEKRCPLSRTTVSAGGISGKTYRSFPELYQMADQVLYEIKQSEKGRCVIREI